MNRPAVWIARLTVAAITAALLPLAVSAPASAQPAPATASIAPQATPTTDATPSVYATMPYYAKQLGVSKFGFTPGKTFTVPWNSTQPYNLLPAETPGISQIEVVLAPFGDADPAHRITATRSYSSEVESGTVTGAIPDADWAYHKYFCWQEMTWWFNVTDESGAEATHSATAERWNGATSTWTSPPVDRMVDVPLCFWSATVFSDVPISGANDAIHWMATSGISRGWRLPDGSLVYREDEEVDRGSMAAFLYRMAGSPAYTPPAEAPFTDVPTSHSFYKEISWLAEEGISRGWSDSDGVRTFRPSADVTRDHMAAFLYRYAAPAGSPPAISPFSDIRTTHPLYKEIAWLSTAGISLGYDGRNGTKSYRPTTEVTRLQMAYFLHRMELRGITR